MAVAIRGHTRSVQRHRHGDGSVVDRRLVGSWPVRVLALQETVELGQHMLGCCVMHVMLGHANERCSSNRWLWLRLQRVYAYPAEQALKHEPPHRTAPGKEALQHHCHP